MFLPYSRSKGCLLRHLHTQLPLRATFQHRMSAECKNLWLADLQAHSVTAGRVQNKMCFSARSDYSPQLWLILCGQFSRKGEASCLGVLAGVNHCCRCRLESQQSFVASGAFVFGCHPENRPPTLGGGSRSCFPPRSSLLRFALNCVSAHRSVFVPSSRPSSLHIVLSSLELLSPYKIECWSIREFGGSSQRNNYLNIFPRFIFEKYVLFSKLHQTNHPLMDTVDGCRQWEVQTSTGVSWQLLLKCEFWHVSSVENKSKKFSITENFLSQTVGSKCSEMWPKTRNPSMYLGCSDL